MISAVRALLQKHREIVSYVFWGVMTTLVNYAAYLLLTGGLHIHYLAGNAAAWAVRDAPPLPKMTVFFPARDMSARRSM